MFSKRRLLVLHMWFMINTVLFCYCCITMACYFDKISLNIDDVPLTRVNYVRKVTKREIRNGAYSPLRIHVHFGPLESAADTQLALKSVLQAAISTVSQIFQVTPVSGPLLLDRIGCIRRWNYGINKGKCSDLNRYYKGEFCENKIDLFQIPPQHLKGLEIYNQTSSSPIYSLPPGQGVINTDFIMYVISHTSDFCLHQDVQAYASYCRLDQNGRPIAGFINFCPNNIEGRPLHKRRLFHITIHEIFHSLGFSKDLFHKYRTCDLGLDNCTSVKHMILKDSHGLFRLNLPSVVQQMKKHFNCPENDFGAPMEVKEAADKYSSHWDPLIMFGSIMTASVGEKKDVTLVLKKIVEQATIQCSAI